MAPTYQATSYSNIYSNQSSHWSNDWSYQSSSNASSSDMSNYWSSYDPDYWPTFQPAYQQTTTTTNPYFSSDLNMSLPGLMDTQQSLPDFIALMSQQQQQQQADFGQSQGCVDNIVEGVVDPDQLREELAFLARRKERQDLLLKKDERKKLDKMAKERERQKKVEEEKERLVSSSFQLPMFDANWQLTVGKKPWLSDNYLNSRFVN